MPSGNQTTQTLDRHPLTQSIEKIAKYSDTTSPEPRGPSSRKRPIHRPPNSSAVGNNNLVRKEVERNWAKLEAAENKAAANKNNTTLNKFKSLFKWRK